jgi:hypothetical protein
MGFTSIAAAPGRSQRDIIVSIPKQTGHKPRIRISIHPTVVKLLGWETGMMIEPMHGDGADRGLLKLRLTNKGGFKLQKPQMSGRGFLVFCAPPGSPDSHAGQPAEYTVGSVERSLTLRLPWADRTQLRVA